MMTGNSPPTSGRQARAASRSRTTLERGTSSPISSMIRLNFSRSSPRSMASSLAPMSSTPWRARMPSLERRRERLSAVWPPRVGSSASGFSRSMIFSRASGVSGSM